MRVSTNTANISDVITMQDAETLLAYEPVDINERLLSTTSNSDSYAFIKRLSAHLKDIGDLDPTKHDGIWSRLTGADLEARIRFHLSVQQTMKMFKELETKAKNVVSLGASLRATKGSMIAEQDTLSTALQAAKDKCERADFCDDLVEKRYLNALANLVTMHTANDLSIRQIDIALYRNQELVDHLKTCLRVVRPLWQRDAMAFCQSLDGKKIDKLISSNFRETNSLALNKISNGDPHD